VFSLVSAVHFVLAGGEDKTVAVKVSRSNSFPRQVRNGSIAGWLRLPERKSDVHRRSLTPNTATGDRTYNPFAGSYDSGVAGRSPADNTKPSKSVRRPPPPMARQRVPGKSA
jgi:hypothetical protein